MSKNKFGGQWTKEKLDRVQAYLQAYMKVLKNTPFKPIYIDAFAGTGYSEVKADGGETDPNWLPGFEQEQTPEFMKGSAVIALQNDPPFMEYYFIEKKARSVAELESLRLEFPGLANRIHIQRGDANASVRTICQTTDWRSTRAVLFLDPFGMEVEWQTVAMIAGTKAIDLWILFPSSLGVNRQLGRTGVVSAASKRRLDLMFGGEQWEERFYAPEQEDMFGPQGFKEKTASTASIVEFFNERLKTIFPGVAQNPRLLRNSVGAPLFHLCFAAANEKGKEPALRIAEHILGM